MTARLDFAEPVVRAAAGHRQGERLVRRLRDGMGRGPDELLHELLDVLDDDGIVMPVSPRLRAFLRVVGRAIEGEGRA